MLLPLSIVLTALASLLAALAARALLEVPVLIVGHFIAFELSTNRGFAFGLSLPLPYQEIAIAIALVLVCIAALRAASTPESRLAFGLIIGGACGNLLDRWLHGAVTDYAVIGTFPVFNLADAAISIGVGLLLLDGWFRRGK